MYEFRFGDNKPKHQHDSKLCHINTDSFIIYINTDNVYEDIKNYVDKRFDKLNH